MYIYNYIYIGWNSLKSLYKKERKELCTYSFNIIKQIKDLKESFLNYYIHNRNSLCRKKERKKSFFIGINWPKTLYMHLNNDKRAYKFNCDDQLYCGGS